MKFLVFYTFFLLCQSIFAQKMIKDSSLFWQSGRYSLGGMVGYYFWEEDDNGKIKNSSLARPFRRNEIIVFNQSIQSNEKLTQERMINIVSEMSHENGDSEKRFFKAEPPINGPDLLLVPLRKRTANAYNTVQFRLRNGIWESYTRKNVVYFNIYNDSSKSYSHSSDSIVLKKYGIERKAMGHYFVKTFWNEQNEIIKQEVFSYAGEDLSDYFISQAIDAPCHVVIFSNGYRGPKKNRDETDNLITKTDRFRYWMKLDKLIINRIKPDDYFYIDGSNDIATSNHRSMTNFSLSISRIKALRKKEKNAYEFKHLNTSPNLEGFMLRKKRGEIAANAYLALRCNSPTCLEVKDTIDVVCHSMGYAYALGFVETIKDYVVFGKMYIIAAENASCDGTNWKMFQEVWQYGSNLDQINPDPVWEQDGIAPQSQVKNLDSAFVGGRVFFPPSVKKKNFIDSHMLKQYHWIIKDLKPGDPGYIK